MSHEKDRPLEGRRVLVIEDEFIVALDLGHTLRSFGCEVLGPVASIAQALALLGRERPDAATLDLNLLDGLAVPVAELLAGMGVPFLVCSAYDTGSVDHPLLKHAPRLGKPFSATALRN